MGKDMGRRILLKKKDDDPNAACVCPACFWKLKVKEMEEHYKNQHYNPEHRRDNEDEDNPCENCDDAYGSEECQHCEYYG